MSQCSLADLLIAKFHLNYSIASERGAQTAKRPYGKAFFAKLFAARQKACGPACNAGAFLATSLCTQRSSIIN